MRNGRRYIATVARGKDICLQGDKSDVQLQITAKCPDKAYFMEVRTDVSSFSSIQCNAELVISNGECFIAPMIKVLAPAKTDTSAYILWIPHCLSKDDDMSNVKVRMLKENRLPAQAIVEVPESKHGGRDLYYKIGPRYIELHTPDFSEVFCTICQTPPHCLTRATSFIFGKFETFDEAGATVNEVEIRPYFCSIPYKEIVDFRQVSTTMCFQAQHSNVQPIIDTVQS